MCLIMKPQKQKKLKRKKQKSSYNLAKKVTHIKEIGEAYSNRVIDSSWDFKRAFTKEYTHCFHSYPAMMIPQVARRLIENYGKNAKLLFDPFCGTGTSLVEANLYGINAVGTDINPLARLIAQAKTTILDIQVLDLFLHEFFEYAFKVKFNNHNSIKYSIPKVNNIDFWFSKNVQTQLALILHFIENINDEKIKNFFKVAFSETVRESSNVKSGEFKLVRSKNFDDKNDFDVFGLMVAKLSRNRKGLIDFQNEKNPSVNTKIFDFNTADKIPPELLLPNSVDIVVTSPPYGDSRTTVAYGQYSRLANEWLGYKEANQIDKKLLGGSKKKFTKVFNSEILNYIISRLKHSDNERALDVESFFIDYENSIKNISSVVKRKGYACFVVGNRTVKGITIPTDQITVDFLIDNGFEHVETFVRNIPNKRMPLKNSPSNISGETSTTMKNEYIVICQKVRQL